MIAVDRRYGFLRLIIWLLRIAALLIILLTILTGVLVVMLMTELGIDQLDPGIVATIRALGTLPLLPGLLIGILVVLLLLTVAELMRVALDSEENTRSTAVSQQMVLAELHTFIQQFPDLSTLPQMTRFVADDLQRITTILGALADEQRIMAHTLQTIERKLPPAG